MAIITQFECEKCGQVKRTSTSVLGSFPTTCFECDLEEGISHKNKFLDELSALSVERRLRLIEEWIYDQKFNKTVKAQVDI